MCFFHLDYVFEESECFEIYFVSKYIYGYVVQEIKKRKNLLSKRKLTIYFVGIDNR